MAPRFRAAGARQQSCGNITVRKTKAVSGKRPPAVRFSPRCCTTGVLAEHHLAIAGGSFNDSSSGIQGRTASWRREDSDGAPVPGAATTCDMRNLTRFARTLEERLQAMTELRRAEAARLAEAMRPRAAFRDAFDRVAYVAVSAILRPRIEALAAHLPGACIEQVETPAGRYLAGTVGPSIERPAIALLSMGIAADDERLVCAMSARAELIPAVAAFAEPPILRIDVEAPPWDDMVAWTEDTLLSFLDHYVAADRIAAGEDEQLVRDPVCGMMLPMGMAPERFEFRGETFAFCTARCRAEFLANPRVFIAGE